MDTETKTDAKPLADASSATAVLSITDVKQVEKPSTSQDVAPKSLDAVAEAFVAKGADSSPAPDEGVDKPVEEGGENAPVDEVVKEVDPVEKKDEPVVEEEVKDANTDESLTDPAKPPPFHEHPRWKEVVAERDALRPLAEAHTQMQKFCQQHDIPTEEVNAMFEIAALMRTDPKKAYERLTPIVQAMEQHLGIALPADLEADVASGKRTPENAQEVAKLRADALIERKKNERAVQQSQVTRVQSMTRAVQDWIASKQKLDIGFKPKINGAPDGLWELVDDRYARLVASKPPTSEAEAVALAEQAYASIKKVIAPVAPSKPIVKPLSSNGTSTTANKKPKNLDEVAMRFAGTSWSTRKQ